MSRSRRKWGCGDVSDAGAKTLRQTVDDGGDLAVRHRYLASLGISDDSIVDLEYFDYARFEYLSLGMPDTMP